MSERFILIVKEGETLEGESLSAKEVLNVRLKKNSYPIYERTRNRTKLKAGDSVAFYLGGKRGENVRNIVATARIKNIVENKELTNNLIEDPPIFSLEFENIIQLNVPINFFEKLPELSFCPKNFKKWGVVLMGGIRNIQEKDWIRLF